MQSWQDAARHLAGIGLLLAAGIAVVRTFFWNKNDRRRWLPAFFAAIVTYWLVEILWLLVVVGYFVSGDYSNWFMYALGAIGILVATFGACLFGITIAPRAKWKQMSYICIIASAIFVLYFERRSPAALYEFAGCIAGAAMAYAAAYQRFGRTAGSAAA